jgi:hypothetical protein
MIFYLCFQGSVFKTSVLAVYLLGALGCAIAIAVQIGVTTT